jgi:hypothetical protein
MRDTIDMARAVYGEHTEWTESQLERLKQFEALVRADEREACAIVCDELSPPCGYNLTEISFWDVTSLECAAAIRARGNT